MIEFMLSIITLSVITWLFSKYVLTRKIKSEFPQLIGEYKVKTKFLHFTYGESLCDKTEFFDYLAIALPLIFPEARVDLEYKKTSDLQLETTYFDTVNCWSKLKMITHEAYQEVHK